MKTFITKTITLNQLEVEKIIKDYLVNTGVLTGNIDLKFKMDYDETHIEQLTATSTLEG